MIITPHVAGLGDPGAIARIVSDFVANNERFRPGEQLPNLLSNFS